MKTVTVKLKPRFRLRSTSEAIALTSDYEIRKAFPRRGYFYFFLFGNSSAACIAKTVLARLGFHVRARPENH